MRYLSTWVRQAGIAVLLCMVSPLGASADARTDARLHFDRGMTLIAAGDALPGIAELRRAYEILPHPNVLYNIGLASAQIGRYSDALEAFQGYVASDPPDRAEAEALVARIEERIAEEERRAQSLPEPVTVEGAPEVTPGIEVSETELEALDESALQIETLAEVSDSPMTPELRERAERLRELAAQLRAAQEPAAVPVQEEGAEGEGEVAEAPPTPPEDLGLGEQREQIYEERVISASRANESPVNAPNSLAIITAQDIRLSGIKNLPELFRRAAGVEVFEANPYGSQVSIRGFNDGVNPRILVLINGRSVYWDWIGSTQWQSLPLTIEDIERVEIIRGPASALYGADAFTGIINILTRDPGQGDSFVTVQGGGGDGSELRGAMSVTGRLERLSYRFSGGREVAEAYSQVLTGDRQDVESFLEDPSENHDKTWFSSDLRYNLGQGYYARAGTAITAADTLSLVARGDVRFGHIRDLTYNQAYASLSTPFGLGVRTFWNSLSMDFDIPFQSTGDILNPIEIDDHHVLDAEVEFARDFELVVQHQVILGVGYRFKTIDWDWLGPVRREHHYSAFFQDTMFFGDLFQLVGSARVDRHPLLDDPVLSPRGSAIFHPTQRSAIRLTAGTAFRTPTFIESYFQLDAPTPFRGVYAQGRGSEELDPERMLSFELGYVTQDSDFFTVEANAYLNYASDPIRLQFGDPPTLSDYVDGELMYNEELEAFPAIGLNMVNIDATLRQIGGEIGIRTYPVEGLDIYANYSYHDTEPLDERSRLNLEEEADDERTSRHKVNLGVQLRTTAGFDFSADIHIYSGQRWVVPDLEGGFERVDIPAHALLNARAGYRLFSDRLELAVIGRNLLFADIRQHPWGQRLDTRVLGEATFRF